MNESQVWKEAGSRVHCLNEHLLWSLLSLHRSLLPAAYSPWSQIAALSFWPLIPSWCVVNAQLLGTPSMRAKSLQSSLTLGDPVDCSPSGSSVHESLMECVAILFSRGSFRPRDQIWVSCIAGRFFTLWATRKAQTNNTHLSPLHIDSKTHANFCH